MTGTLREDMLKKVEGIIAGHPHGGYANMPLDFFHNLRAALAPSGAEGNERD